MTPEDAVDLLDALPRKRRGNFSPEQRRLRAIAKSRAQKDAYAALARLHSDEYDVLYRAAAQRRLHESGFDR